MKIDVDSEGNITTKVLDIESLRADLEQKNNIFITDTKGQLLKLNENGELVTVPRLEQLLTGLQANSEAKTAPQQAVPVAQLVSETSLPQVAEPVPSGLAVPTELAVPGVPVASAAPYTEAEVDIPELAAVVADLSKGGNVRTAPIDAKTKTGIKLATPDHPLPVVRPIAASQLPIVAI